MLSFLKYYLPNSCIKIKQQSEKLFITDNRSQCLPKTLFCSCTLTFLYSLCVEQVQLYKSNSQYVELTAWKRKTMKERMCQLFCGMWSLCDDNLAEEC